MRLSDLKPRYLWLLGAVVVCATGLGFFALHNHKKPVDQTQLYGPVIGDWKAKKPKQFIFYWAANSQKSIDAYRQYVSPLMKKEDSDVQLLIVQVLASDIKDENGPGGLMLCPKRLENYAKLVSGYLNNGENVSSLKLLPESKGRPFIFLTNATLDEAQKQGLFDPAACMTDDYFWSRLAVRLYDSKKFFKRTPLKQLPQIEINGTYMLPDDPRVARFVRTAKASPASPAR